MPPLGAAETDHRRSIPGAAAAKPRSCRLYRPQDGFQQVVVVARASLDRERFDLGETSVHGQVALARIVRSPSEPVRRRNQPPCHRARKRPLPSLVVPLPKLITVAPYNGPRPP